MSTPPAGCTDDVVIKAIIGLKTARAIEIPKNTNTGVHGFSHEYINYMLGGTFQGVLYPA
jgi:carbon-monoxide dehydrogenase catalytic subunit